MESNVAELGTADRLWTWFMMHRRGVVGGAVVAVVAGVIIGFVFWRQDQKQVQANSALSNIASEMMSATGQVDVAQRLVQVSTRYPNTAAARRALLLAAGQYYDQGKYDQARKQFDRYLREYPDGAFADQARLGIAACYDAVGKTKDAITAYTDIVQHYPSGNVAPLARLSLAGLYVRQGKWDQARDLYTDLTRNSYGSISAEAAVHLEDLNFRHPRIVQPAATSTNPPGLLLHSPKKP